MLAFSFSTNFVDFASTILFEPISKSKETEWKARIKERGKQKREHVASLILLSTYYGYMYILWLESYELLIEKSWQYQTSSSSSSSSHISERRRRRRGRIRRRRRGKRRRRGRRRRSKIARCRRSIKASQFICFMVFSINLPFGSIFASN